VRFAEVLLEREQKEQKEQYVVVVMGVVVELGVVLVTRDLSAEPVLEKKSPGGPDGVTTRVHRREVRHDQTRVDGPSRQGKA
jgi:hypothetical protein